MSRVRKQTPAAASSRATIRRAPRRNAISINLARRELKALMVEQSSDDGRTVTVYRGSHAQLVAAGVPEAAFPTEGNGKSFRVETVNACSTGSSEVLEAAMNTCDGGFELEIGWGAVMPYVQCAHPAIAELARMVLIDASYWAGRSQLVGEELRANLWHTFDKLAKDPRASGFKPEPGSPRLRISPEFRKRLEDEAHRLYLLVHRECEVFTEAAPNERQNGPALRLAVDNTREDAR